VPNNRTPATWRDTVDPSVTDDRAQTAPRVTGDWWVNLTARSIWSLLDDAAGAADWVQVYPAPGGGGSSDHATLTHLLWTASGHLGAGGVAHLAGFDAADASILYTVSGTGTVVALATSASLTTPTFPSYVAWTDTTANAGAAGRLQRNGAELSWHNGTAATNLEQVGRKGAANGYASLDASVLVPVAQLPIMAGSGASHAPGIVPDPPASSGTTKFLREDATWSVPIDTNGAAALTTKGDLLGYTSTPARVAVGADGTLLQADSSASAGVSYVNNLHPSFGTGGDGDITFTTNTTLTQPQNYNNVTINSGVRVICAGFITRVYGTLTFTDSTSIISNNGGNASGTTAGAGAAAGQFAGGSLGGAGFNGAANGNPGAARTNSLPAICSSTANAGDGGVGGTDAGAVHSGGAGGDAQAPTGSNRSLGTYPWDTGLNQFSLQALAGGAGGGAGGGSAVGAISGAGGGGAGVTVVWANKVTGAGIVEAQGGNGSNASGTGSAGGGGGGGGGVAVLFCRYVGTAPTVRAQGGAVGTNSGAGTAPGVGKDGYAELRRVA